MKHYYSVEVTDSKNKSDAKDTLKKEFVGNFKHFLTWGDFNRKLKEVYSKVT